MLKKFNEKVIFKPKFITGVLQFLNKSSKNSLCYKNPNF